MTEEEIAETYPEHAKLKLVSDKSQLCYDFVEWLGGEKGINLCVRGLGGELFYASTPIGDLLAEFFEIDRGKLEAEKLAMIAYMRHQDEQLKKLDELAHGHGLEEGT